MFSETLSSNQLSKVDNLLLLSNYSTSYSIGTADLTVFKICLIYDYSHYKSTKVPKTTGIAFGFLQTLNKYTSIYFEKLFL
jgi:hypothetical protein